MTFSPLKCDGCFKILHFLAWTHVGEHVARGIAILLLLPKDKHKRGEWSEDLVREGNLFVPLNTNNFQIESPVCRLRARTLCTDRRRSASSSSPTATRAAWTTWPWSGATGGSRHHNPPGVWQCDKVMTVIVTRDNNDRGHVMKTLHPLVTRTYQLPSRSCPAVLTRCQTQFWWLITNI